MRTQVGSIAFAIPVLLGCVLLAGCGGTSPRNAQATATGTTTSSGSSASRSTPNSPTTRVAPGALQAEAASAAAGDIPDNQVFLVFKNGTAGYSMKYPEGWARLGTADRVTFRDKNNIVRIAVGSGVAPTPASVLADVSRLRGALVETAPHAVTISGRPAFELVYATESAPNAVTGKRVKLVVDRYYLSKNGRLAVVDLGTPDGVDNVDAYRLMIESFRWS
jgi:hypothetical protein